MIRMCGSGFQDPLKRILDPLPCLYLNPCPWIPYPRKSSTLVNSLRHNVYDLRFSTQIREIRKTENLLKNCSVVDPDDPYVFGPPGSGFIIICTSDADPWHFGGGSGSADPCLWLMDSDPDLVIFVIDLQDANTKIIYFIFIFSAYYFLKVHWQNSSKMKSKKE